MVGGGFCYRAATMPNDPRPRRRSLRLPGYDYSQTGAYFITACTHNRVMLFVSGVSRRRAGLKPAPTASFDHLVGAREQHRWHLDAERPRGLEVDHQLV